MTGLGWTVLGCGLCVAVDGLCLLGRRDLSFARVRCVRLCWTGARLYWTGLECVRLEWAVKNVYKIECVNFRWIGTFFLTREWIEDSLRTDWAYTRMTYDDILALCCIGLQTSAFGLGRHVLG